MSGIALVRPRLGALLPHGWRQLDHAALTALTAYSASLGCQAQVVSDPLYRPVGEAEFAAYAPGRRTRPGQAG